MSDHQLFERLLPHSFMGAALGGAFACSLLALNVERLWDMVQSSSAPTTMGIILIGGCSFYFAFGATITGFQFVLMDDAD